MFKPLHRYNGHKHWVFCTFDPLQSRYKGATRAATNELSRGIVHAGRLLRNLKTTLQMEHLSCKNPENLELEIRMHFLTHNLVRPLMPGAARRHRVPLERVSFAGSLAAARRYGQAPLQVSVVIDVARGGESTACPRLES